MIKLNLGRNCLKVIIRTYGIKEIFIPYYSCKTVWQACREENCKINFYHIGKDFMPMCEFPKDAFILYINYFGVFGTNCEILAQKYKNLITDNTQAFYATHCGIASFNSLRKFFHVQNGAYLQIEKEPVLNFETDNLKLPNANMHDNYVLFRQNELTLNDEPIKLISPEVEAQMGKIDFERDKNQRAEIFMEYAKRFDKYNLIKLPPLNGSIPYCYPICTNDEKILKKFEGLTILRLWDEIPKSFNEYEFLHNVASLPLNKYIYKTLM